MIEARLYKDGVAAPTRIGGQAEYVIHFVEDDHASADDLAGIPTLREALDVRPLKGWKEYYKRRGRGDDGVWEYEFERRERSDR